MVFLIVMLLAVILAFVALFAFDNEKLFFVLGAVAILSCIGGGVNSFVHQNENDVRCAERGGVYDWDSNICHNPDSVIDLNG